MDEATTVLGTAGDPADIGTRVMPAAPGSGGGELPPGLPPTGGRGPGGERDPRQTVLLAVAGVLVVAIAVVAILLATHSSGSTTTSAASGPSTTSTAAATTTTSAAPATTTTAPSTTAAPTTAAPTTAAASTAPAQTPQQALNAIVAELGPVYAVSPIAGQDRQQYVAVDHQATQSGGGAQVVVDVYLYTDSSWVLQATVPLGADGSTGLLQPASQNQTPISVVAVTGAATPDFAVTTTGASTLITTIVSDQTGTWRAVPFAGPNGTLIGVPSATITGATVTGVYNSCQPNCAQGSEQRVAYTYRSGTFVPVEGG